MLKRITPLGRLAPGNPKTSSPVFHSPAAFWSPVACAGEIVGSETRRMITAAKVPVLIDDGFVFFIDSSNAAMVVVQAPTTPQTLIDNSLYSLHPKTPPLPFTFPNILDFPQPPPSL